MRQVGSSTRAILVVIGVAALSLTAPIPGFLPGAERAARAEAAVDADRLAAAKELMEATGAAKQFDLILPLIMQQIENAFVQLKPEHSDVIKEVFKLATSKFTERKQEAFDQVAIVFAEGFTASELREIVAFYKTPIGVKLIKAQPEIAQKTLAIGQAWGRRIGQDVEQEVRKELKQRGIAL
jgi:uncharacterized protein